MGDWPVINNRIKAELQAESPAVRIRTPEALTTKVDTVVQIIGKILDEELPETNPCPFTKRWWTCELSDLKQTQNCLSNKLYKLRHILNHPIHDEYKTAVDNFVTTLEKTKAQHWIDWLENITAQDIYIANKYITDEPNDYSSARIPSLITTTNGLQSLAESNSDKDKALAQSFFPPPPPTSHVPPNQIYPTPLPGIKFFSRDRIREAVRGLSPYKAPGISKIQNVVLTKCIDALMDHLYYIFRAIFKLGIYPPSWLESVTVVLRKQGKTAYDVAKAYWPIGLLDTIAKLLSTLMVGHISYLAEKHNVLPLTQFGSRPGRNTSDAMLLVTQKIKDAWRSGKVAAALFLDVQGAFPNTVKKQLLHNMKMRRVPKCFVDLTDHMLTGRTTRLRFDDYISDPIPIDNGTTQGDPLSMLFYGFYNAPLLETARPPDELSPGFVDDSMMLAVGDTLSIVHSKLKDMMERPRGGFEWSRTHNSPFELSKVALMNFPRSYRDEIPGPLILDRLNNDGTITTSSVAPVKSYKYLGVIFDPALRWKLHHTKVAGSATFWTAQIWRIAKTASGMSPSQVRQLFNTVAVPGFTYACEVWYTGLHTLSGGGRTQGSVGITKKLRSAQRKAAKTITGALGSTAGDTLDVHADILPIDLLFHKILYRAAARLCTLPPTHPLHAVIRKATARHVTRHHSPIYMLFYTAKLKPGKIETINSIRQGHGYKMVFSTIIPPNKDAAFEEAERLNTTLPIRIYCDGSGFEGGIRASVVMYHGDQEKMTLIYHLGSTTEHTVYGAEGVGISLAMHMLLKLNRQILDTTLIGTDSQALV